MSSRLVMRIGAVLASAIAVLGEGAIAQTTTLVSVDSVGQQASSGTSRSPSVSADGRYVAFSSTANNLVPGDTNNTEDVFVHDNLLGITRRASISLSGSQFFGPSFQASLSADGRYVVFTTSQGTQQVLVYDYQTGNTTPVSVSASGSYGNGWSHTPAISGDGHFVAFVSEATDLVVGDTNNAGDVFIRDMQLGTTALVSVSTQGVQGNYGCAIERIAISSDGRFVAFISRADTLIQGDANNWDDVFLRDRLFGTTSLVSVGNPFGFTIDHPSVSDNGRFVAFDTSAQLSPLDANTISDIYIRDMQSGTYAIASVSTFGAAGNSTSQKPWISGDGRYVGFESYASNLVSNDTNACIDVFMHDMSTGMTSRASVSSAGAQANWDSYDAAVSATGTFIAFQSYASNLVSGDTNGIPDVFLLDTTCTGSVGTYCTAKTNSLGCIPSIGSLGLPSQSGSDNFYVTASNVLNNKLGMMLWSLSPASNPFGGGTLCLHSPIVRTPAQLSGGSPTGNDCSGSYAYHFTQGYMIQQLLGAYTTVYAQWWSRDPGFAVPNNIGLTNGLSFTICP